MAKGQISSVASGQNLHILGGWTFLIGVILAVVFGAGFLTSSTWLIVLVVIGIIVGLINVASKEVKNFLFSSAILIIVSSLGKDTLNVIPVLRNILDALLSVFIPAAIIVAIKHVFVLERH